jgi:GDP-L-fucose synthase
VTILGCGQLQKLNGSFPYKKVTITGGAGFLGRFVTEKLKAYDDVETFVPRSSDYDLVQKSDIDRLLDVSQPDLIIHLAGVVGGPGPQSEESRKVFLR